ncbi:2-keto-4-pentenoate hydratase [Bombilactobacillus bombi]|uniref:2-keto-4-pentenoate hydratase n=1 Tax=Bombilactobacillus bombi TaxID=1303590 RepID=UPI000E56AE05|nr:2-keto-4-pentenoate hydratase [Bombilactobacillus bombi]AXX64147.1 2-keto-4-pentenoate hydratase [Bombilactobacillus bombi]
MNTLKMNDLTENEMAVADNLFHAYQNHQPLQQNDYQGFFHDEDSAYRVQYQLTQQKEEKVGGYKVSLTSEETQKMFDSDSPLYGAQVTSHFLQSPAHFTANQLMDPLAEVELMFTAQEDLSSTDSLADLMKKTTVAPAVEVPDSRFSDWFPSLSKYLVVADAAVGGYVVYGQETPTNKMFTNPDELTNVKCQLFHDGQHLKDGAATEVLGNPLNSLQWLVQKLESQNLKLTAGQRVSSGTFLLPEKLTAGEWEATFNCDLGAVKLTVD